jgi:hypothetical protein
MPGPALHLTAGIGCPHGAPAQVAPGNPRVLVAGQPVATMADQYPVTGCPFQVPVGAGTKPQPCVRLQWTVPAARVLVGGAPVVLATSTGTALSVEQIPQGPPAVAAVQPRVVMQ